MQVALAARVAQPWSCGGCRGTPGAASPLSGEGAGLRDPVYCCLKDGLRSLGKPQVLHWFLKQETKEETVKWCRVSAQQLETATWSQEKQKPKTGTGPPTSDGPQLLTPETSLAFQNLSFFPFPKLA